jgi:hypothetical protein
MTTLENRADRDKHWDAFGKDDYWRKLSAMPEYQNNVPKGNTWFLFPTDYSDILSTNFLVSNGGYGKLQETKSTPVL